MKAKSLLLGFLIGGTAAGISTLLTAPASGKETRKYVGESKDALKIQLMKLKHQLIDIKNAAASASKEGKEAFSSFSSDIKLSVNNWKNEILPHQQELSRDLQAIETVIQELEETLNKSHS